MPVMASITWQGHLCIYSGLSAADYGICQIQYTDSPGILTYMGIQLGQLHADILPGLCLFTVIIQHIQVLSFL